jgi:hypothetical protein
MMSGSAAITGNEAPAYGSATSSTGGGLYLRDSIAVMSGGTISGNESYSGGGVVVYQGTSFTMNAGDIYGNAATGVLDNGRYAGCGGGVYINGNGNGTIFDMRGGAIGNAAIGGGEGNRNTANMGGGVYVVGLSTTLTLSGGAVIGGNTAYSYGGGVYCSNTSTFAMYKSTVYGQVGSAVPTAVSSTGTVPADKANYIIYVPVGPPKSAANNVGKYEAFYGSVTFKLGSTALPSYNGTTEKYANDVVTSNTTSGGPGSLTLAVTP